MVIRVASILQRVCGLLALGLGILFWTGNAYSLLRVHILLGFLVVVLLWIIGIAQALSAGGSWAFAAAALVFGAFVLSYGMLHPSLLPGPLHWLVQLAHLLLGLFTVAIGQIGATRARAATAAPAIARSSQQ